MKNPFRKRWWVGGFSLRVLSSRAPWRPLRWDGLIVLGPYDSKSEATAVVSTIRKDERKSRRKSQMKPWYWKDDEEAPSDGE